LIYSTMMENMTSQVISKSTSLSYFEVLIRIKMFMVAGYDGLFLIYHREIFEVSITTQKHIAKYGTYVSKEGELSSLRNATCQG
jgi:hypothetical protein